MTRFDRLGTRLLRWLRSPAALPARRYATAAVAVVVVTAGVVVATTRDGYAARVLDLGTGSVWVTSEGPGQLALLDGVSAAVTVRLKVADGGHDLTAVQGRRAGYAVDHTTGTLIRADAATWQATATTPIDGATAGLTATAADNALYATDVQRGLVVTVDPDTLQPAGQPQSLSATRGAGTPVADGNGTLWLLDSTNGDLIRTTEAPRRTESGFAAGTASRLVIVQGAPVVVDLIDRSATTIDPQTGHRTGSPACTDNDPTDPTVTVAGSTTDQVVYLVSGRDGVLRITDLADGTCNQAVPITTPGTDLGESIDLGGRVFVPDRTTGQVIIVDPKAHHEDVTDPVVPPGTAFELLGADGFVYYNDRASNLAGVVHLDGTTTPIAKYDPTDPDRGVHQDQQSGVEPTPEVAAEPTASPTASPVESSADTGQAQTSPPPTAVTPSPPTTGPSSPTVDPGTPSVPPPPASTPPPPTSTLPAVPTSATEPTVPTSPTAPTGPTAPTAPTGPTSPSPTVLTATLSGPATAHAGDPLDLAVTASEGEIIHAAWDFGDGATAETATGSTTHTWSASRDQPYRVTVVVTVPDGRTADAGLPIQITEQPPATLTVEQPTGGIVVDGKLLTCPSACTGTYPRGSSVRLAADPDTGKIFSRWTGDCAAETTSTCTLAMSADRTAGAVFVDDPTPHPAIVTGMTFAGPWTDPTVTISGQYFGSEPPPSTSAAVTTCGEYGTGNGSWFDKNDLWFRDDTGAWEAGASDGKGFGDCVGIVVQKWSPTTIVFKFGVSYNSYDHWYITQGDSYRMVVRGTTSSGRIDIK